MNRGWQAGYAFLPRGTVKRIGRLLRRGNLLAATELFWSRWNPLVTYETTRPLYQLCGGNKRQLFATAVCFLYSGVFLHWAGGGLAWFLIADVYNEGLGGLSGFTTIGIYAFMGLLVILSKVVRLLRNRHRRQTKLRPLSC